MSSPTDQRNGPHSRAVSMPPVPQRSYPSPLGPRTQDRMGNNGDCLEAQSLDFYYGKIKNTLVEELLRPYMDARGSFLLRDSNTETGVITISVVDNPRHIYHFKINCSPSGLYEVTENLRFRTLNELINFFYINEVPGKNTSQLKLVTPIRISSPKTPPRSPPTDSQIQSPSRPPRPPRNPSPQATWDPARFISSRPPLPIPKPDTEPIYFDHDHVYCRAEDLKKSRIDEIMDLCMQMELSNQKYKKCTCGLYMEQSKLVDNWMMHIDRTDGDRAGSGRIFFVNEVTNVTLWELPDPTMVTLSQQYPEKYNMVQKLLQEGSTL